MLELFRVARVRETMAHLVGGWRSGLPSLGTRTYLQHIEEAAHLAQPAGADRAAIHLPPTFSLLTACTVMIPV